MKPHQTLLSHESKFQQFDTLMQFRVKHILLVSSSYDSYILEEDGQLTDLIYNEYLELNLSITPHVKRASNAEEALKILEDQDIDLILIFKRVSDINVYEFGRKVKKLYPDLTLILLAYHERELAAMKSQDYKSVIDQTFIWSGDVKILLSIIKLVEDRINIDHDTDQVGVRVIILVEDSIKFYSSYLPLIYREIMQQTRALMSEGLNISHKILRMRARPKILLAENYEQAVSLFNMYKKYLLAVISDFRFDINGKTDDLAGIKLVEKFRKEIPDLPVLMQSSAEKNEEIAYTHNVGFLSKRSAKLHKDLRSFIMTHFGFGDFVFTDPESGEPIARANDFKSMEKCLENVDDNSLLYHAHRNHFSNWLMARTEFDLADRLRPRKVNEFKGPDDLRNYLISTFKNFRHEKQRGQITDFARRRFDLQSEFVRIGGGSLGGKGRGLAYVNALLNQYQLEDFFEDVHISIPLSAVVGTDVFDEFMEKNKLFEIALSKSSDNDIIKSFLKGKFPKSILADFDALLEELDYPLAIRSSSMLEDSHLQTFAGLYDTYMIANNKPLLKERRSDLETAIKRIYASTFLQNAKSYHDAANNRLEEEKMAVIIQRAVGSEYNKRFYPSFSGVALSYNYYSLEGIIPEDGVVYAALGFGKTIVEGMNCIRFSPSFPNKLPHFSTIKDMLNNSQREFYAIDLDKNKKKTIDRLVKFDISDAELDGTLLPLCSTYSPENDRIYDGFSQQGTRIISFAPILKSKIFPLSDIVKFMLQLGSQGLNCPVEIEFAVDLSPDKKRHHEFYFLQIRPMIKEAHFEIIDLESIKKDKIVAQSFKTLGNMQINNIKDIIVVNPETFDRGKTIEIASEVGILNDKLITENKKYLLIGPGRWGTTERWLGIPVVWSQINAARVIMETAYGDFCPDPSFGTHFFQNLTSFRIGYFTVNPNSGNGSIDLNWIINQNIVEKTKYLLHLETEKPIEILIDGRLGKGIIAK